MNANTAIGSVQLRLHLQSTWLKSVGLNCAPVKGGETGRKLKAGEKITECT